MMQTGEKWDRLFCVKLNGECYEDAMIFLVFILIFLCLEKVVRKNIWQHFERHFTVKDVMEMDQS